MSWPMASLLLLGGSMILLFMGMPVALSFIAINLIGAALFLGGDAGVHQLVRNSIAAVVNFSLTPIPLFILMGEVLFHTGLAVKVIDGVERLIRQVPGGERRELLQGLEDKRQVWLDLRAAPRRIGSGQAGLGQHSRHRAMVHVQLTRDGADAPFLDMMIAQDLRLKLRRDGHGALLVSDRRPNRRRGRKVMRTRGGQRHPHQWQRHNPRP